MKKNEIKVGATYIAKVSNKLVKVQIVGARLQGWTAKNLETNRLIWIKSAQRLRSEVTK